MYTRPSIRRPPRSASVLILTLVVVALLTLGAMAFFQRSFLELRATRAHGRHLQARHLAESGVEYLKYVLSQDAETLRNWGGVYLNPNLQGRLVVDDPIAAFRGRITFVAPDMTTDGYYSGLRYGGLENESARLNLNTILLADDMQEGGARTLLMALPGMTESIADAILDWIDEDDEPRPLGAEQMDYSRANYPYGPRNGPLHSIEELLLVRDVTPALLFGADLNRDVLVQPLEEPLQAIEGADNSTGALNRGWLAYLTIDSAERNVRPDGSPKIDVNMDDLETLHAQLSEFLSTDQANFIIAFRQGGAYDGNESGDSASGLNLDFEQEGRERLTTILDLIGTNTSVVQRGQTEETVVESPFGEDSSAMQSYLPKLMENLAVNASPTIPGRLNINQAPRRLLMGIPGMDSILLEQIISNRDVQLGVNRPEQTHETWLLSQGLVDVDKMKELLPLITAGGDVYRARVVGYFEAEGPLARLEVVIDATQRPPVVRRRWELEELGQDTSAYAAELLGAQADNIQ